MSQIPKLPGYSVAIPVSAAVAQSSMFQAYLCIAQQTSCTEANSKRVSDKVKQLQQQRSTQRQLKQCLLLFPAAMPGKQEPGQEADTDVSEGLSA